MNCTLSYALPIRTVPTIKIAVPSKNVRFRPSGSAVKAAKMAPKTAPTSYKAVIVPTMSVLGLPMAFSQ